MSLATWKKEFYPEEPHAEMTDAERVEHGLRKWRGLFPEVLMRHGLTRIENMIFEDRKALIIDEYFLVDDKTCALCHAYVTKKIFAPCVGCPYYRRFGRNCDRGEYSDYKAFVVDGNPAPMIKSLEILLASMEA